MEMRIGKGGDRGELRSGGELIGMGGGYVGDELVWGWRKMW